MKSQRFPDLPPLATLVVFESAAYHESFSKAAEELFLSASAVAHQVKKLEESLNLQLFDRHARGVILNRLGQEYYSQIHGQLSEIQTLTARLKRSGEQPIRIKTQHAVAQFWLQAILKAYQGLYDDSEFEITATSKIETLPLNSDIAIGFFEEAPRDSSWVKLWPEYLLPVKGVDHKSRETVLYLDSDWESDWDHWKRSTSDQESVRVSKIRRASLYSLVVQSVLDNQGIMIGRLSLLDHLMKQNLLVASTQAPPIPYGAYYLYRSPYSQNNPSIDQFYQWLCQLNQ